MVRLLLCAFSLAALPAIAPAAETEPLAFQLTFDKTALATPFTGRVFVIIRNQPTALDNAMSWFKPEPGIYQDVVDWNPGEPLALDISSRQYLAPYDLKPGKYHVRAIMDRDLGGISFSASPGNLFSKELALELDPKTAGTVELKLDQVQPDRPFKETENVKLVDIPSPLLTKFHGKPMRLRAGVVLPPSFTDPAKPKYPVVYEVMGFNGNHFGAFGAASRKAWDVGGTEMLWVVPDASCRLGHHVFADSENNGPVGKSFVEELIPHIEKTYRGNGVRFTAGHSSGGWSSLWLQVTYPETFAGCWSTAPDPVDLRDFQRVNVYEPKTNIFTDPAGKLRPIARMGGKPVLFYQPFSDMEEFMGRGGQLSSFEAVFSPRGKDGQPMKLWNRRSGAIDPSVAKAWEKYDIRLVLESNWKTLGPKLAGKVHVFMGDEDTFYLDGATRYLKASLTKLESDAVVELFPGRTHMNLVDAALRKRMNAEMAAAAKAAEKR